MVVSIDIELNIDVLYTYTLDPHVLPGYVVADSGICPPAAEIPR